MLTSRTKRTSRTDKKFRPQIERLEDRITPIHHSSTGTTLLVTNSAGTSSLTDTAGASCSVQFSATGGDGHYSYALSSGSLPAGVSLNGSGLLSGTATKAGTYSFTVLATDTTLSKTTGTEKCTLVVNPGAATTLSISAPASATAGTGFSVTISAYDNYGDLVTGTSGTVSFTSSDGQTVYGSVTLASGTGTGTVMLNNAGYVTLTGTLGSLKGTSGSINVTSSGADWFAQNMPDLGLQNLARTDFTRDGSITYGDMAGLLNQAVSEGTVTSAIFTSLQAIVSSSGATYLHETADVQNLGYKLVNGDPANAYFQGTTPLGNLAVGSSATQLQMLTEKWFLGEDHPIIDTQYWGTSGYALASGTLFGSSGLPSYQNVYQGQEGDCWLLASFAVTANNANGQAIIQSQFTYEGTIGANGAEVWSVRFYDNGVAQYVTVDNYLPMNGSVFMYANWLQNYSSSSNVLWVALDEKAYAQLCASGWNSRPTTNSYASLNSGSASTSLPVITGGTYGTTNPLSSQTALINALTAGTLITMGSGAGSSALGIAPDHDYGVLSYNSSTGLFTILNPWGWNTNYSCGSYNCPGLLYLTYSQITSVFGLDGNENVKGIAGAGTSAGDVLAGNASLDSHVKGPGYLADAPLPHLPADITEFGTPYLAGKLSGLQLSAVAHKEAGSFDIESLLGY
jgi:hypothetical protein